ncbi:hypothetical protein [Xanthomonas campestris]|uniref:hypothetical protein n=1 Tax=Xanthomonas campestris TaxID=339 RepID=UPI002B23587C|nr:hypothetical protein [Xanthomonas campestris]MEA9471147.1 hypothetical protein [Xanthomonas campestris]MEB1858586.1 hypothetical protein [Xanthomonas campestris pv. campestris]
MSTTEVQLQSQLHTRISNLCEWLSGALEIAEMRRVESVTLAKKNLYMWLCETWDRNDGDTEGALAYALECYVDCLPGWADDKASFEADLSMGADPPWELSEFHLLVASFLADQALFAFNRGTKKQRLLAAMLYADAVDCREHWSQLRGPAGARNPETKLGKYHAVMRSMEERIACDKEQRSRAKKAIAAKLRKDPKQAAKSQALKIWQDWQSGRAIHASGAAFARHVVETTAIDDPNTVQRWIRQWRKVGASGSA